MAPPHPSVSAKALTTVDLPEPGRPTTHMSASQPWDLLAARGEQHHLT